MRKPILVLDFDGVIHSYETGWHGPWKILDPPVPRALSFISWVAGDALYEGRFKVCILSSRSKYPFGRLAMKRWLRKWGCTKSTIERLRFPLFKPAAFLTIDDRAITFDGKWPEPIEIENYLDELLKFKPWNKNLKNG